MSQSQCNAMIICQPVTPAAPQLAVSARLQPANMDEIHTIADCENLKPGSPPVIEPSERSSLTDRASPISVLDSVGPVPVVNLVFEPPTKRKKASRRMRDMPTVRCYLCGTTAGAAGKGDLVAVTKLLEAHKPCFCAHQCQNVINYSRWVAWRLSCTRAALMGSAN